MVSGRHSACKELNRSGGKECQDLVCPSRVVYNPPCYSPFSAAQQTAASREASDLGAFISSYTHLQALCVHRWRVIDH